jgi:hypothetical protein
VLAAYRGGSAIGIVHAVLDRRTKIEPQFRLVEYCAGWLPRFVNDPSEWRPIAAKRVGEAQSFTTKKFFLGNRRFPAQKIAAQLICLCLGAFGYYRINTLAYRPGTSRPVRITAAKTQYRQTDWGGRHETNGAWVCYA